MVSLTDDEFRALIEQSTMLEDLTRHPGWPVLEDWALHRTNTKRRQLLNGSVVSLEEYKNLTGELRGAEQILQGPTAVAAMVASEHERRRVQDSPPEAA